MFENNIPDIMQRMVERKMKAYREKAEALTRPLAELCKRCTRVVFVMKNDGSVFQPLCKDMCPFYKRVQTQLNELTEEFNKENIAQ